MKKYNYIVISILFMWLCLPMFGFSQSYPQPDAFDFDIVVHEPNMGANIPYFLPIGWSENGVFAYQMIHCDGGCGCCYNKIIIQSAVSDKVLNIFSMPDDRDEAIQMGASLSENSKWRNKQKDIDYLLSKYQIRSAGFNRFYETNSIQNYQIILKKRSYSNDDNCYGMSSNKVYYEILVGNPAVGYKSVTKGKEDCIDDISYLGYFKSPFENRILIVLSSSSLGFEREQDFSLDFFGCSLNPKTFR